LEVERASYFRDANQTEPQEHNPEQQKVDGNRVQHYNGSPFLPLSFVGTGVH